MFLLATYDHYYPAGPGCDVRFVGASVAECKAWLLSHPEHHYDDSVEIYEVGFGGDDPLTLVCSLEGFAPQRKRVGLKWEDAHKANAEAIRANAEKIVEIITETNEILDDLPWHDV